MIRIESSSPVWATTRRRPEDEMPNVTKRLSSSEWSGSAPVADKGSKNTLAASSKETPCFRRFPAAFSAFHSKRNCLQYIRHGIEGGRIEESPGEPGLGKSFEGFRRLGLLFSSPAKPGHRHRKYSCAHDPTQLSSPRTPREKPIPPTRAVLFDREPTAPMSPLATKTRCILDSAGVNRSRIIGGSLSCTTKGPR